ncbi:MAG TPA: insulinase family protein [Chlamydiales bacterium]|nr:insulinase family protein [Chlamydiales bacterium]
MTTLLLSTAPFIDIPDTSNLPLLSPDLKERQTAKIELQNGLQILLISDPGADKSAAVVGVGSGSWCDPAEYPGMAHFCEHMLFMGTEKYPDNEFSAEVSNFQGNTNAFTAPDKTVYMFSSHHAGFSSLLDRFAHFFIDPIFDPSNISRELHAVDQEFALMRENDGWREYMVFKETGNPKHPNRFFSAGNSKTLAKIPQSALKNWHKDHYSANVMRVAIYSPLPIEELKSLASTCFAQVPKNQITHKDFKGALLSSSQKNQIISVEPIKNQQTMTLVWELPTDLSDDESKSAELIAYTLQRGSPHSLLDKLKKEKLVDDIKVGVEAQGGKDHAFFEVRIALSDIGIQKIDEVITYVFQAFSRLKSGISEDLFSEKNALRALNYQYQSRTDAFAYISQIGRILLDEDLSSFPRKTLLATEYNAKKIESTLALLTPDQCVISLLAPKETTYEKKEQWLQVPYSMRAIPQKWIASWRKAKPHPEIQIPELNPFTPNSLNTVENQHVEKIPTCIANHDFGSAFYIRCEEFQTPEAAVYVHILTPAINASARSYVLASLYIDHITDQLNPILSNANAAGITPQFKIDQCRIHLTLTGFSEKIPLLLQEIIAQMPMHSPTQEQFDLYVARHAKAYENSTKILPVKQAKELLTTLINDSLSTKQENLEALRQITFEDFRNFHINLFDKTYFEALFAGNLTRETAFNCWQNVQSIAKSPFEKENHPQMKALHLPENDGPFQISKSTQAQGNAAILLIDEGDYSHSKRAAQKILSAAIQEPFFDTLRTKQKTGYIAQSSDAEFEKRLYQFFLVQSNTHQPEDLLHRFELFLEEFRENFVTNERFNILKNSTIATLKTQYRNLEDKSAVWDLLAFQEKGNFTLVETRIQALEDLSYEQFTQYAQQFLSRENRKRLALLYTGKIPSPFVYMPMNVTDLSKVAIYAPR